MTQREVSDKNIARFERAVKKLNSVIADCKQDNPDCFAYLDGNESLCLMSGEKGVGDVGDNETIITIVSLSASGGDW